MAFKRTATSDLNHDNWDKDDESEEAGSFTQAPEEILEKRVVKTARRRIQNSGDDATKSAFGSFAGFKTTPATTASPFSFLSNLKPNTNTIAPTNTNPTLTKTTTSSESKESPENGLDTDKNSPAKQSTSEVESNEKPGTSEEKPSEYYAKLKGLNEGVTQWIKKHVDTNPFCILTPVFRDYEKYLEEIEAKHGQEVKKQAEVTTHNKPIFECIKKTSMNAEKKTESSIFGNADTGTSSPWKPEKSIFGNTSTSKSIFATESKTENKSGESSSGQEQNPFLNKPTTDEKQDDQSNEDSKPATLFPAATFSFGQSPSSSAASAGFSFGSAKPFSFGAQVAKPESKDESAETDEKDEEPPKPDFKPVTEEGSIFEQRCKVYVKKDGNYSDRGVGTLFLKPTPNEKMQLIVRAGNSLGNILLNTLLTESIPLKRMNKNSIMLVCLPTPESQPPPTSVLLRVKTSEDAETLMEALEKNKK